MTTGARRTLGAVLGGLALALLFAACERAAVPETAAPAQPPSPAQPQPAEPPEPQATCADSAIRLLDRGAGVHGAIVADTLHMGGAAAPVTCLEPANQSAAVLSLADGGAAQVQQSQYYLIVIRYPDGNRLYVISRRSDGTTCIVNTNDECVAEVSDLPDDFDLSDLPDDVAPTIPAGRAASPQAPAATDTAPAAASDPQPRHGAAGVAVDAPLLSWSAAARAVSYDVYWGTARTPAEDFSLGTPITTTDTAVTIQPPGATAAERRLTGETTYYWRVDAKNDAGATPGPVWSFTTGAAPALPGVPGGGYTPPVAPPPAPPPVSWIASACLPDLAIHSQAAGGTIQGAIKDSVLHWGGARSNVECLSDVQRQLTVVGDTGEARQLNAQDAAVGYRVIRVRESGGARHYVVKHVDGEPSCISDANGVCVRLLTALADDYELAGLPADVPALGGADTPPEPPDTPPSWPASARALSVRATEWVAIEIEPLKVPAPLGSPAPAVDVLTVPKAAGDQPVPAGDLSVDAETLTITGRVDTGQFKAVLLRASNSLGTAEMEIPITMLRTCDGDVTRQSIIDFFSGTTWTWAPDPSLASRRVENDPWPDDDDLRRFPAYTKVVFDSSGYKAYLRVVASRGQVRIATYGDYSPQSRHSCTDMVLRSGYADRLEWSSQVHALIRAGKSVADYHCGPVGNLWAAYILLGSRRHYLQPLHCRPAAALAEGEQPVAPVWPQAAHSLSWVVGDRWGTYSRYDRHDFGAPTGKPAPQVTLTGGTLPPASRLALDTVVLGAINSYYRDGPPRRGSGTFTLTAANSAGTSDMVVTWEVSCPHSDAVVKTWLQGSVWKPMRSSRGHRERGRPYVPDSTAGFWRLVFNDNGISVYGQQRRQYAVPRADYCRGFRGDGWVIDMPENFPNPTQRLKGVGDAGFNYYNDLLSYEYDRPGFESGRVIGVQRGKLNYVGSTES